MTKKVKIVIPAGTVTVDLPFYCLYIDFAAFPANFWTDTFNNGGDIRAYAEDQVTKLPQAKMNRFSSVAKYGGMYVRTPIKAAVDTVIYINYNTLGLSAIPPAATNGAYDCFAGFKVFCHNYGWAGAGLGGAYLLNQANGDAMDIVGTIQDGDGPVDCFNFSGSGGYVRKVLGAETIFTIGVASIRNPGDGTDMTAAAFGEELRYKIDDVAGAVYNAVDGYTVGDAYTLGKKYSMGVTHNGTTARALFTDGTKTIDTAVDGISATQFAFGASYDGTNKLRGAIRHVFVYDGILPDAYFEAENAIHGDETPNPPIDDGDGEGEKYVIYFAGTSLADINLMEGIIDSSTSTSRISATVTEGIYIQGDTAGFNIKHVAPLNEFYASFNYWDQVSSLSTGNAWVRIKNSDLTVTLIRLRNTSSTNVAVEVWNGSTYTIVANIPSSIAVSTIVQRYDVYFRSHATNGRIRIVIAGIVACDFTGKTDYGFGDYGGFGFYGRNANQNVLSGITVSDANTEGSVFYQMLINAAGSTTQWTGAYTDIDETAFNDVDYIETLAANQISTFNTANLASGPTASLFDALVIAGRASIGVSAPTQMEGVVRVGSTNYSKAPRVPLSASLNPTQFIYDKNPATGQPWTGTEINAAEVGVKSIA